MVKRPKLERNQSERAILLLANERRAFIGLFWYAHYATETNEDNKTSIYFLYQYIQFWKSFQRSKFLSKKSKYIDINQNFCQKSKVCQKSKCLSKIKIIVKNRALYNWSIICYIYSCIFCKLCHDFMKLHHNLIECIKITLKWNYKFWFSMIRTFLQSILLLWYFNSFYFIFYLQIKIYNF